MTSNRVGVLLIMILIGMGCAGSAPSPDPMPGATPANRAPQIEARVTAIAVVTNIRDVSMARRISQDRAMRRAAMLLTPGAVGFGLEASGGEFRLSTFMGANDFSPAKVDFEKLEVGWLARVSADRSAETQASMARLDPIEVSCTVRHPDPAKALQYAEIRVIRQAIATKLPPSGEGEVKGQLTLIQMEQSLSKGEATVRIKAHVNVSSQGALGDSLRFKLLEYAADEHRQLGEWEPAIAVLNKMAGLDPHNAAVLAALGETQLSAQAPTLAAEAFERAFKEAPKNLDLLKRQIEALRAIPDEKRAIEAENRLKQLEDQANQGKQQPKKSPR